MVDLKVPVVVVSNMENYFDSFSATNKCGDVLDSPLFFLITKQSTFFLITNKGKDFYRFDFTCRTPVSRRIVGKVAGGVYEMGTVGDSFSGGG